MAMREEWKRQFVRKASRAVVGGFRPPETPLASWFGDVRVGGAGEVWPVSDSHPLAPLCQFNLTEIPYLPERLANIAFLTVFIAEGPTLIDAPNGNGWLLRAYSRLDELIPLSMPADAQRDIKPFPIRWELIEEDYPCREDLQGMETPPARTENYSKQFPNHACTKIGGWPTLTQSEIIWAAWNNHFANPEYVFQIDSEPKAHWSWGDLGVGYIGRGTGEHTDVWTLSIQSA